MSAADSSDYVHHQNIYIKTTHGLIQLMEQSKNILEETIDNFPNIFAIVDKNGSIIKGNIKTCELLNCGLSNVLGRSLGTAFQDSSWEIFVKKLGYLERSPSNSKSIEFELFVDGSQMERRVLLWQILKMPKVRPDLEQLFIVSARDVTELRKREEQLKLLNENLELEINDKSRDISELLNSVGQGIFAIDNNQVAIDMHSKKAEEIFCTEDFKGRHFSELMNLTNEESLNFESWFELVTSLVRTKKWHKYIDLCPIKEVQLDSADGEQRVIKIDFFPIFKENMFDQMLVLGTDVTQKSQILKKVDSLEKKNRLFMERTNAIAKSPREIIKLFVEEALDTLDQLSKYSQPKDIRLNKHVILRIIHTLKGNAESLEFVQMGKIINDMEDVLIGIDNQESFAHWKEHFVDIKDEIGSISNHISTLFPHNHDELVIPREDYDNLCKSLKLESEPNNDILQQVIDLDSQTFKSYLKKHLNFIKNFQRKSGKNIAIPTIINPNEKIHNSIARIIDMAFIHIIRNALDHGIEENETRKKSGKNSGNITFEFHRHPDSFKFIISDDGRGIDPDEIGAKAIEKGLIEMNQLLKLSDQEKINLIFTSGFSTLASVSDLSGRGVGLDAVKSSIEKYNGQVSVLSEVGKYTKVSIDINPQIYEKSTAV